MRKLPTAQMKAVLLITILFAVTFAQCEAIALPASSKTDVTPDEAIVALSETVQSFDEHARAVGGAGFFYGVKSKLISIVSDRHCENLEKRVLVTSELILYASKISEDDPNLGKKFVRICELMPTAYDTYEGCAQKVKSCVKILYPNENSKFCQNIINKMREDTGATWLK